MRKLENQISFENQLLSNESKEFLSDNSFGFHKQSSGILQNKNLKIPELKLNQNED